MARPGASSDQKPTVEGEGSTPRRVMLTLEEARAVYRLLEFAWFPNSDYAVLNTLAKRLRTLPEE